MKNTYRVELTIRGSNRAVVVEGEFGSRAEAEVRAASTWEQREGVQVSKARARLVKPGLITYAEVFGGVK